MKFQSLFIGLVLAMIFTSCQSDLTFTLPEGEQSFKMIYVDGGSFDMGCTSEQSDCGKDEFPVHNVTLSSYYIGEFEVTQGLWQAVMGTTVVDQRDKSKFWRIRGEGANYPMYYINYEECEEFCSRLTEMLEGKLPEGYQFSLPTEAQWEYAARGGKKATPTIYAGSDNISDVAWYAGNSGELTHEVGQKAPNELGVYDMSGNVSEWCVDWYDRSYYSNEINEDPVNLNENSYRVFRGGNWFYHRASQVRVSYRNYDKENNRYDHLGLRVVLVK